MAYGHFVIVYKNKHDILKYWMKYFNFFQDVLIVCKINKVCMYFMYYPLK